MTGKAYNTFNPHSINEIWRNETSIETSSYESRCLDLRNVMNVYTTSPYLGGFATLGPRGECNIIKKVPVSSDFGDPILEVVVSANDYLYVSKQVLHNMEFKLVNAKKVIPVPLHGAHVSFSWICCNCVGNLE
jgi:hypothetical protein